MISHARASVVPLWPTEWTARSLADGVGVRRAQSPERSDRAYAQLGLAGLPAAPAPARQPPTRRPQPREAPRKTFIGRIEKGFDFLGYHFDRERLTVATATVERFVERATRLYEQRPGEPAGSHRLGMHVRRWAQWVRAGLGAPVRSAHGTANGLIHLGHRSLARLRLRLAAADP